MRFVLTIAVILVVASSPSRQQKNPARSAARPEAVVQRFVDAAEARDAVAMAAVVTPDAIFARFPSGEIIVQGRERIQDHYSRQLQSLPRDFRITIKPRIVEGQFVIDQEHFSGITGDRRQATWMYLVRDGFIQRAWVLETNPIP
jgi:hypothetical protein